MKNIMHKGLEIKGYASPDFERVLSAEAMEFVLCLHHTFNKRRGQILQKRMERQKQLENGVLPDFLSSTRSIREDKNWRVATTPPDLQKRHVEITGPAERKMIINALNSGADIFMADFEDSLSPTWTNIVEGQINLMEAVQGVISLHAPEGKVYRLHEKTATLMVRPRGWHLNEKHVCFEDEPLSAALFDFGLFFFHNSSRLIEKGSAPYFYLPKLESHEEARLWNDIFIEAQQLLNIPVGTIRATVLIETILAAFEMEEILYELKDHCAGLNAGRWDYIFSIIKKFHSNKSFVFPDRSQITMTVPFMKAYTDLLIHTCHKRAAHAIGGMAAFIPSRKNAEINTRALENVRLDKQRESHDGFDGTWVAHPDLVPIAREIFADALGSKPHQKDVKADPLHIKAEELLNFAISGSPITMPGLRLNIEVALQYLESWLRGVGAVAIHNMMEDTATAEISRSQLWQWLHSPLGVIDGEKITSDTIQKILHEELEKLAKRASTNQHKACEAMKLLEKAVLQSHFDEFITIPAYELLV